MENEKNVNIENNDNMENSDITKEAEKGMEAYIDEIDSSFKDISKGDVLEGTVVAVKDEEVIINIGFHSDGIIPREEFDNYEEENKLQAGDKLSVYVLNPHDKEGNIILSQKRALEITALDELEKAFNDKTNITIKVRDVVKGGVTGYYKTVRCFIPASLLSYRYVDDLNAFIGKELVVKVEDFDLEKKRVVLSRKAVETEECESLRKSILENIEVGKKYKGTVTKLMNYGAFVDIGGVEGLVHISDISWNHIKHPSEIVSEGEEVEVSVISFDAKKGKIGLDLKKAGDNPWYSIKEKYHVGEIVEGKVKRLADFGAFIEIEEGLEGLVHVSEISWEHVKKPSDVLKPGDKVNVKILNIDINNQKLSLSIREAEKQDTEAVNQEKSGGTTLGDIFGDKFKDFFS